MGVPTRAGAVPSQCTVLIARVARVLRQRFEQVLAPLGLRQRHVVALSYLRGHGPTAQQLLAERLRMDASSLVCLLNELEDSDLILRHRDRSDRRRAIVELSARGESVLSKADRAVQVVEDEMLAGLADAERDMLHALLARLNSAEAEWVLAAEEA
ncbi:MAG: MarR family winged helix-turn-helix transcriptional regulator [Solirubrobacteraceae bacterium]